MTAEDVLFETCRVAFANCPVGFTVKSMTRAEFELAKRMNPQFNYCVSVFTTAMENYAKTKS